MSLSKFLPEDYGAYFENDFRHRWLRPTILEEKLKKFKESEVLVWGTAGFSEENRRIQTISFGNGSERVLLWTQMHGNEPTATMALVDLLNLLTRSDDYDTYRQVLAKHFTLLMIPMLNPDGAERFSRRNALQIDPNRDALRWQTAEMRGFKKVLDHFSPHWAFNLHDQRSFFSVGHTVLPATISFLAASADRERRVNPVRKKSMALIASMWQEVRYMAEGHFGRYTDEFYPRALGEFFHRQNTPCILIESGAYPKDPFRDQARRLNFCLILKALESIYHKKWEEVGHEPYASIPENGKNLMDLIIRNCKLKTRNSLLKVDLGFRYEEKHHTDASEWITQWILADVGDLSFQYGLEEEEGGILKDHTTLTIDKPAHLQIQTPSGTLQFKNGQKL